MAELNYCPVCGNPRNADGGCYMCGLHPKKTEGPHIVNICPYCLASSTHMAKLLQFRAQVNASEKEHDQIDSSMMVSTPPLRQIELVNGLDDAPSAEPEIMAKRKVHVASVTNDMPTRTWVARSEPPCWMPNDDMKRRTA